MRSLFEKVQIREMCLKNRFILAAANDNCDEKERLERFSRLAEGEIGLLITGGQSVGEIPSWKDTIMVVHKKGGKIALQIVSEIGGRFGFEADPIAVSVLEENHIFFQNPFITYCPHHEATEGEIGKIVESYAEAAKAAEGLGADAIEIHAAHQSFLSQFLSPLMNRRNDKWGGSVENRSRILLEIYRAIRSRVSKELPLIIKLGVEDSLEGGLSFDEGQEIAALVASYGYDAIEVSQGIQDFSRWSGTPMRMVSCKEDEAYFRKWSREIKKRVSIPVILTGGLRSFDLMETIIKEESADYIGLCRPLIREPEVVKRWKGGDYTKATCVSCNQCIMELLMKGLPLECYLDKKHK